MVQRFKTFTKEFTEKEDLDRWHKLHLGQDSPLPAYGYPDMGAGHYSRKLPYKEWFEFNCLQRVHGNSLEHMVWVLPALLVSGAFMPRFTLAMGCTYVTGRELYRIGYTSNEGANSKIREMGALPLNAAGLFLILAISSIYFRNRFKSMFGEFKFY
mmetsp:Transcript_5909/g.4217  ORF Transcript_5909/g.4217 Transcript_5909/m.4217 type:complete len:156 (+) Transcript_5909:248-715(+)|eukprot:CAMPEP_0116883942 /NCGR_PEP_ID=MMETSP0463-20121206/16616_1 /TAXON_ID=181622 /ORGANISM="Strombidinopsis sp, Strain SopsisLIS2011" /LENGTH=155 /DNA_ID=CAMNT_0004539515 /DNA_START=157 /DNA_END=624 /DNA_ORIENTATION=-